MIDIRARMRAFLFVLAVPNPNSCLNDEAGKYFLT
jgi:hypothetical protein